MFRTAFAFLKKDFLVESSYRLSFLFNIFTVLVSVLSYFFIDRLFGQTIVSHLEEFGVNYFSYVLLAMAFFSYIGIGAGSFSSQIHNEQVQGTLEAILLSPAKIYTILFSMGLWNLINAAIEMALYIILGIYLFHIDFSKINILSSGIIMFLSISSFNALGIISASFTLLFKRGNPFNWIVGTMEGLISGVYFPITILPDWLQFLAQFFPITYAIRAIELAVYRNYTIMQLQREITFLALFSLILAPLSLRIFSLSLKKARKYATLGQY